LTSFKDFIDKHDIGLGFMQFFKHYGFTGKCSNIQDLVRYVNDNFVKKKTLCMLSLVVKK